MPALPSPGGFDVWGVDLNAAIESLHTTGTHAARPTTGLVTGSLYACTDHGLIERWNGTAWSDWSALETVPGRYRGVWAAGDDVVVTTYDFPTDLSPFTVGGTGGSAARVAYGTPNGGSVFPTPAGMAETSPSGADTYTDLNLAIASLHPEATKVRFWHSRGGGDLTTEFRKDATLVASFNDEAWTQRTYTITGATTLTWRSRRSFYDARMRVTSVEVLKTLGKNYQVNDLVSHNDELWSCALANTTTTPGTGGDWVKVSTGGVTYAGDWAAGTYATDEMVRNQGALFIATEPTSNEPLLPAPAFTQTFASRPTDSKWVFNDLGRITAVSAPGANFAAFPSGVANALQIDGTSLGTANLQATLTLTFHTAGTITFWEATRGDAYDYGRFKIDGAVVTNYQAGYGTAAWTQRNHNVAVGTHTFQWNYVTDAGGTSADARMLVANITTTNTEESTVGWDVLAEPAGDAKVLLLDNGAAVPAGTAVGTLVFEKSV